MKLVTFETAGSNLKPGVLTDKGIIDVCATDDSVPESLKGILQANALQHVAIIAADPSACLAENAVLRAPIQEPQKVIGIGLNYRSHAIESSMEIPSEPVVFCKFPSSVIGPDEPIRLPSASREVDFEAELVVVIGRQARNVPLGDALDYVAGYTIGNDVSARDWQLHKPAGQWLMGKSFDTFAPTGPALVTADECQDPQSLAIELRLNGKTMQESTTSDLIFGVAELIHYLSAVATLEPGDLIFSGTPPGVGFARKPPVYLQPGDVCEVEIQSLGVLRNECVASKAIP